MGGRRISDLQKMFDIDKSYLVSHLNRMYQCGLLGIINFSVFLFVFIFSLIIYFNFKVPFALFHSVSTQPPNRTRNISKSKRRLGVRARKMNFLKNPPLHNEHPLPQHRSTSFLLRMSVMATYTLQGKIPVFFNQAVAKIERNTADKQDW